MRGQHLFFATREDLLPGLEVIESRWELEYQVHELRHDRGFIVRASLLEVPGLGISTTGQCMTDESYLVYPRDARPRVSPVPQRGGGVRYDVELAGAVVHFLPGGSHAASGALVCGRVARVVDASARGIELYRAFSRTRLRGFHPVGREAYREFKAGRRLATIGAASPPAYDLVEGSAVPQG